MKKPRDYQIEISNKANTILKRFKLVFLICEVRTGKTLMALNTAKLYGAKNVLFLTKKKAISSIENDYNDFGYSSDYKITIINNESLHKVEGNFDFIVMDESHRFGSFPKPCKMAKDFKNRFSKIPMILMTGTLTPESYSQIYHQFWVSEYSPFKKYTNFYKWAVDFVNVKKVQLGYAVVNDYSDANQSLIERYTKDYIITLTQFEAGFTTNVKETILEVEMEPITYKIIAKLKKDKFVESKKSGKLILGDTAVKLMQKHLQLASGTVKFEDGTSQVIDYSKAIFVKEHFKGKKLAIFYKFKEELNMLIDTFGENITTDLDEFNSSNKHIACQFVSFREGVSLSKADFLVAINIDFSNVTYTQFRDRLSSKERLENELYWIFSKDKSGIKSIEKKVYESVMNKQKYSKISYNKDFK